MCRFATTCDRLPCCLVQVLLAADPPASLGLVNDWGLTAVALAEVKGHSEARDALLAAGGTVAGLHTFYPLHAAAIAGDAGDHPVLCTISTGAIIAHGLGTRHIELSTGRPQRASGSLVQCD